jgi:uncharacterized protein (TIGR03437 family)
VLGTIRSMQQCVFGDVVCRGWHRWLVVLGLVVVLPVWGQQTPPFYRISAFAGASPTVEGVPAQATYLWRPSGIVAATDGTVYVAEPLTHRVRKISPQGIITTVAGNGQATGAGAGGPATSAGVWSPLGVTLDAVGNLYIATKAGIRRVEKDGTMTSLVTWEGEYQALALAVDHRNNVYFSIAGYCGLHKVSPDGTLTGIGGTAGCGNGFDPATLDHLLPALGLAVDSKDAVYALNTSAVRRIGTDGALSTILLPQDMFGTGLAMTVSDELLVADPYHGSIIKISSAGTVSTIAAKPDVFPLPPSGGVAFYGLASTVGGVVLSADPVTAQLIAIPPNGRPQRIAGAGHFGGDGGPATAAVLNNPQSIGADALGNVYVADNGNSRIRKVDAQGIITTIVGTGADATDRRINVPGTAVSLWSPTILSGQTTDNLVFADLTGPLRLVRNDGTLAAAPGFETTILPVIFSITTDGNGDVYYADAVARQVKEASPSGVRLVPGTVGLQKSGIAVNSKGQVYLAHSGQVCPPGENCSQGASALLLIDTDGKKQVLAGGGTKSYQPGMAATDVKFSSLSSVAQDGQGNIIVSDTTGVYLVDTSGSLWLLVRTGAAEPDLGNGGDAALASLMSVDSVATDAKGTIYVTDALAGRIRVLTPVAPPALVVRDAAVVNSIITSDALDCCRQTVFLAGQQGVGIVYHVTNLPAKSTVRYRYRRPDGSIALDSGTLQSTNPFLPEQTIFQWYNLLLDVEGLWSITLDINGRSVVTLPFTVATALLTAVQNAASYQSGNVSPGEIIILYGTGLGPPALAGTGAPIRTTLAGTRVDVNGLPAPLLYTSDHQVAAIIPYAVTGTTVSIQVRSDAKTSNTLTIPLAPAAPGLFTLDATGKGPAAAISPDGTANTPAHPATPGSYLSLFATGEGATNPTGVDGSIGAPPLPAPVLPVTVMIDGTPALVTYAGAAPGLVAGVMQVNIKIPDDASIGTAVPIMLSVGNTTSQAGVTIAITRQ